MGHRNMALWMVKKVKLCIDLGCLVIYNGGLMCLAGKLGSKSFRLKYRRNMISRSKVLITL